MEIILLLCSPRERSFNRSLALRASELLSSAGHAVRFHDLCAEGFDPVMDESELARGFSLNPLVQTHCAQLGSAGGLLVFHPDWWGGPPAQLKGWIDRVLRQGVGYDLEGADHVEKEWRPLLGGKKALVFVTTDSPDPGDASRLELFWSRQVLGKCGMICGCEVLMDMRGGRAGQRVEWMASLERRLAETFPAGA